MSTTTQETFDEWVVERVRDRTEPDPESDQTPDCALWTSGHRLLQDADKTSTDVEKADIERSIERLTDGHEILYWHGFVTLATEEYLHAVIESERNASLPRKILIGRVNRYLGEIDGPVGDPA